MREERFRRIPIGDSETWHRLRRDHIQASDAAAVLGCSPWRTAPQLYDIKVGAAEEPDISDRPYVKYGKAMEPLIRAQFELDNPWFKVTWHEFDILESLARPWQGCTLDGEIEVIAENPYGLPIGARGVLEIKTGSFRSYRDLKEWEGQVPDHYYCQVIHQLATTCWDFAFVVARLKRDGFRPEDRGIPEIQVKQHLILVDEDVRADIEALNEEEAYFHKRIQNGDRPPLRLRPM